MSVTAEKWTKSTRKRLPKRDKKGEVNQKVVLERRQRSTAKRIMANTIKIDVLGAGAMGFGASRAVMVSSSVEAATTESAGSSKARSNEKSQE